MSETFLRKKNDMYRSSFLHGIVFSNPNPISEEENVLYKGSVWARETSEVPELCTKLMDTPILTL